MTERHVTFVEAIRKAVKSGWGVDAQDESAAFEQVMKRSPVDTAAICLMEIVRRVNQVSDALSEKRDYAPSIEIGEPPSNAGVFPDKLIGDFLYEGSLDDGVWTCVIVAKDDEGHCQTVPISTDDPFTHEPYVRWASDSMCATMREAVRHAADSDIKYHGQRFEYAKTAMKVVEEDGDLSAYENSSDLD